MSRRPITFESDAILARRRAQLDKALRFGLLLAVLAAVAVTSLYFYLRLSAEETEARRRLLTFTELRASAVERFLSSHEQETALWAGQSDMRQLATRYVDLWQRLDPREREAVRRMLVPAKLLPEAERQTPLPLRSEAINAYLALHRETLERMEAFRKHHGYRNVYFFTPDGNMAFAVRKRVDFGLNFGMNGSIYAGSGLGRAFQRGLRLISPGQAIFEDYSLYAPAGEKPVMFMAAPMLKPEGEKVGVYVVEVGVEPLNAIFAGDTGLGRSLSMYAVGPDLKLRSDLPGVTEPTALRRRMDIPAVRKALSGERVIITARGEAGRKVVIALPLESPEANWAVVTEMALAEMRRPYMPHAWLWAGSILLILLLGVLQYWIMRRG